MSEEEFLNRTLNKIDKEFGYDVANTLQLMFMAKEKEIERLNNIIEELEKWCNECIDYHIIARENGDTTISDTFFEIVLNLS